jgi:rod shape-determining protein MreC
VTSVASYDDLVRLRRDELSAKRLQTRVAELEKENEELRSLARAVETIDGPRPLGARVVGRSGAPLTRVITLDVGTSDGVRRGDGVIDKNGVVGLVLAVGRRSCDVLVMADSSSAIDVVVQRTRARGILRGAGSDEQYTARVEDFDKLRDVKPGDAIVTSGLGARFPPGVLVGTVIEAEAPDDSLYLRADVRPAADFARLEHVAVLIDRPTPRAPRLGREDEATPDAEATVDKKPGDKKKPDDKKGDEKKPDGKKADDKKPDDAKKPDAGPAADDRKPDEAKKPDAGPAADDRKPDEAKKPDAGPAADDRKPDEAKKPDAGPG